MNASLYSTPLKMSRVYENGTVQIDGIWVKVCGRALPDALQPVPPSGARMQPLNESSHHYGDVKRMRQMICEALLPSRDVGGKRVRYQGEARGSDSTSVQKSELGRRP